LSYDVQMYDSNNHLKQTKQKNTPML